MVRGLDYYNHTIFEFITEIEGNDLTVCGVVATMAWFLTLMVLKLLDLVWPWCRSASFYPEKQGVALPIENALDVYIAVLVKEQMLRPWN